MEYSTDGGSSWTTYNPDNTPTFEGNQTVKVRVKAEGINPAGEETTVSFTVNPPQPVTPAAPSVTANDVTNKLVGAGATMEYSTDGGSSWTTYNPDNTPTFDGNQTVKVRVKAEGINPAGEETTVSFTVNPPQPVTPAAPSVTANDVTNKLVGAEATMEYSTDGGSSWTTYNPDNTPTFEGNQTVKVRVKAEGINPAGEVRTVSFTVNQNTPTPTNPTPTPANPTPAPTTPTPTPTPTPNVEHLTVNVTPGNLDKAVVQIVVQRTTDDLGKKIDVVTYQDEKAIETLQKIRENGKDTARIVIPDENDEVSETIVNITKQAMNTITAGAINLQIDTENAKIDISKGSLKNVNTALNDDLFFKLIPVREEAERIAVANRAKSQASIIKGTSNEDIAIIGTPITIETNMQSSKVDITLPLTGIVMPKNEANKQKFLKQLAIYIEHSDGEKELIQGKVVEYRKGVYGIRFSIEKFSVFTIVKTDMFIKSSDKELIKVIIPKKSVSYKNEIKATVEHKDTSLTISVQVSDKASWKLYSDKDCKKKLIGAKINLKTGINKAYIKVTAEDGTTKIYTLIITRSKSSEALVTKVQMPTKAVINKSTIAATVESKNESLIIKVTVSSKATYDLYSDKKCSKKLTRNEMILNSGINTAYLKVTAEDGKTSKIYTVEITRKKIEYKSNVKLGLIKSKSYAYKVAEIFKTEYDSTNVKVKKEGDYYRVYIDFVNATAARTVCKDMIRREYIINYYFYQK
jgi:hypothetical protein